jgi:ribonucleoside-diphosphate reductase alpha chain
MLKAVSNNEDHPEEGSIPVQPVSLDIWDKKYRLKSKKGDFVDKDVDDTYLRVAKALSDVEEKRSKSNGVKNLFGLYKMEQYQLEESLQMLAP